MERQRGGALASFIIQLLLSILSFSALSLFYSLIAGDDALITWRVLSFRASIALPRA